MSIPGHANSDVTLSSASLTAPICAIENTAMIIRYGAYAPATSARESPPGRTPWRRSSAGSCPSRSGERRHRRARPASGSAGRHTRSSATIAVTETSAAMMSVSSIEM